MCGDAATRRPALGLLGRAQAGRAAQVGREKVVERPVHRPLPRTEIFHHVGAGLVEQPPYVVVGNQVRDPGGRAGVVLCQRTGHAGPDVFPGQPWSFGPGQRHQQGPGQVLVRQAG